MAAWSQRKKRPCSVCSLRNHSIKELDVAVFSKLTSLRTLDLAHNELKEIPAGLVLKKLTYLDVSENRLTSAAFVSQFPQLKAVCLAGNAISVSVGSFYLLSESWLKALTHAFSTCQCSVPKNETGTSGSSCDQQKNKMK